MKSYILALFLTMSCSALLAQRKKENIRFVYFGEEDKPHGTVLIATGSYQLPTDRGYVDKYFGRCILTTNRTFDSLRSFIRRSRYITRGTVKIADSTGQWLKDGNYFFEIKGSDGTIGYLSSKDENAFFLELKALLHREDLDEKVVADF